MGLGIHNCPASAIRLECREGKRHVRELQMLVQNNSRGGQNGAHQDHFKGNSSQGVENPTGQAVRQNSEKRSGFGVEPETWTGKEKVVLVEWVDSLGCGSSWQAIEELSPELPTCYSVGWVVHDSSECIVLVPHIITHGDSPVTDAGTCSSRDARLLTYSHSPRL